MNIIERVLAESAGLDFVYPKDRIEIEPSFLYLSGESALRAIDEYEEIGFERIHFPERTIINGQLVKEKRNDPSLTRFLLTNQMKIINVPEKAITLHELSFRNSIIAAVDDEVARLGAYGAISLIVPPISMANCLGTGKMKMTVPETIYIEINGRITKNSTIILQYLKHYFNESLVGSGVIIGGNTIKGLNENEKHELIQTVYELGGSIVVLSIGGPYGQVESSIKLKTQEMI